MLDIPSKLSVSSHFNGLSGKRIPQKKKDNAVSCQRTWSLDVEDDYDQFAPKPKVAGGRLLVIGSFHSEGQGEQFTVDDLVQALKNREKQLR